jgi:hypothetical protein
VKYLDTLDKNFLDVAYPNFKNMSEQEKIVLSVMLKKKYKLVEGYMNIFAKELKNNRNVIIQISISIEILEFDDINCTKTVSKLRKIKKQNATNLIKKAIEIIYPNQAVSNISKLKSDTFSFEEEGDMNLAFFIRLKDVEAEFDIWPSWKEASQNNFRGYVVAKEEDFKATFLAFAEYERNKNE